MNKRGWKWGWVVLWLILTGVGLSWLMIYATRPPPIKAGERPNIIFLVIETLRADHLQGYGYARLTMPNLEWVAQEGTTFERASTVATWTLPSVASILTGLPPSAHGIRSYEDQLPDAAVTLAERLREVGYHTAFLGVNSLFEADRKIEQGFDHYYGTDEISGEELNDHLFAWLKDYPRDKPVFLYVHYFDPHCRFTPPSEYREMYWPPGKQATHRKMSLKQFQQMHECFQLHYGPTEPVLDVDYYLSEYDAELRHVDHVMGLFLERLKTSGLYDSSLLFILSDHGEEFYDHGGYGHGKVLYEHQSHIPLIVRLPGGKRPGQRVSSRVSTLDLYPTALGAVGLKPRKQLPGQDLSPLLQGLEEGSTPDRSIFAETDYEGKQRALWQGEWKLLVSPDGTRPNGLFNLSTDPGELTDLSDAHPEVSRRLFQALEKQQQEALRLGEDLPGTRQELTEGTLEQLRSLGYVQ